MEENSQTTNPVNQPTPVVQPQHKFPFKPIHVISYVVLLLIIAVLGGLLISKNINQQSKEPQTASQNISQNSTVKSTQPQISYTPSQLSQITDSPKNTTSLPLGDYKYTTTVPKKGYIYLCHIMQGGGGAQHAGSWITGSTWNLAEKPHVQGSVSWPNATFSDTISGSNRIISGNGLPVNAITGIFPIQSTDPAYQYDHNPNTITAHNFTVTLPLSPSISSTPSCMGGEVGVMLNGVPLFNGFDADNRDAAAHEIQDSCDGHPQAGGEYHYHSLSSCIKDISATTVVGFALDGFPITGPVLPNGNYLTTNDLDECHGMTSAINLDGKQVTMYHYVMTEDFPYSVSCFMGKPVRMQVIPGVAGENNKGSQTGQSGQTNSQSSAQQQPPQAAFSACSQKISGSSCSFVSPNGTISGTCQTPPNQSSMVCAPANSVQQKPI